MAYKKTLGDLATLNEDTTVRIEPDAFRAYYESTGRKSLPEETYQNAFPQDIEYEFSPNKIVSTHKISGSYPTTFRYLYVGNFGYDETGLLTSAQIEEIHNVYIPSDVSSGLSEYGYAYEFANPLVIPDAGSYLSWDDTLQTIWDDWQHEYEIVDGKESSIKGSGKSAVVNGVAAGFFRDNWGLDPFGSNLIRFTESLSLDNNSGSVDTSSSYRILSSSSGESLANVLGDAANSAQNQELVVSVDFAYSGSSSSDSMFGSQGANGQSWAHDYFDAGDGDDLIGGGGGRDVMFGGGGNDELRAGYGHDILDGGSGADVLYGGGGRNTFNNNNDGEFDQLFILSDFHSHNQPTGRLHNGANADTISSLGVEDRITILGASTDELSIRQLNDVLGIFASGSLEAIVTDTSWTAASLGNNVFGDASRFW